MAWVRTTTVSSQQYLQVVETRPDGTLTVLKSFGPYSIENLLRAQQFATSYNQLTDIQRNPPTNDSDALFKTVLAIFGAIVGIAIINELFGQKKSRSRRSTRS